MMIWMALVLVMALVVGCDLSGDTVLTASDNGTRIELEEGHALVIELEGNPTTGYQWDTDSVPTFLRAEGEPEYEPSSDVIGSGGLYTFRFEGIRGLGKKKSSRSSISRSRSS